MVGGAPWSLGVGAGAAGCRSAGGSVLSLSKGDVWSVVLGVVGLLLVVAPWSLICGAGCLDGGYGLEFCRF
jgi:hypothetical protein